MNQEPAANALVTRLPTQYVLFKAECEKKGKHPPKSDGVLVFDEVKVASQMWNSRNQTLTWLAMICLLSLMFISCC